MVDVSFRALNATHPATGAVGSLQDPWEQWLDADRRLQYGHYHRLMCGLRYEDTASYFNFLRVPPDMFDALQDRLGQLIEPGLKLAMTMRHLASGDRYASMKFDLRVPHNTMYVCVRE